MNDWNILWDQTHRSINNNSSEEGNERNEGNEGSSSKSISPVAKRRKVTDGRITGKFDQAVRIHEECMRELKSDAETKVGIGFFANMKTVSPVVFRPTPFRFIFDGRVGPDYTPKMMQMKDGDKIDAFMQQCGD